MKKQVKLVVTALALMLVSFTTNAQFKKSEKFVEGTISYSITTDQVGKFTINPTVGYFVSDRFAMGLIGKLGTSSTQTTWGVGAFGRCYVMNIGNKFHLYSQLALSSNSTKIGSSTKSTTNSNVGLGTNYFVSKKLALSMDVASLIDYTYVPSTSTSLFSIGFTGVNNPFSAAKFGVLYKF